MLGWLHLVGARRRKVFASCFVLLGMLLAIPQSGGTTDFNLVVTTQASSTKSTLMSIQFRTSQNGWAVGAGGTILKTTDGGKKWRRMTSGTSNLLTSVFFA